MIYPKKIKAKQSDKIIKILICISVGIAILLLIINKITTPRIPWAALVNSGIVYAWITVIYSIKRNVNIAGHILLQVIAISMLTAYIDYKLGWRAWSINIAIPIMIMIANSTMLILTIVSHKKYIKYVIFQFIIVIFSMLPVIFISEHLVQNKILSIVASGICFINFILCLALCTKDIKETIIRKFHI